MKRLDVFLTEEGLFPSREKARRAILEKKVTVDGKMIDRPSHTVADGAEIKLGEVLDYVGRGALKLLGAINAFGLSFDGETAIDCGASTGGFTEVMLRSGVRHVYAVDVGHDQLAASLKADSRVTSLEGTDIRTVTREQLAKPDGVGIITADVSFISLHLILPALDLLLSDGGKAIILVKPQFEAGREYVGKNGIVRDKAVHKRVLRDIMQKMAMIGWNIQGCIPSPVRGMGGNIEYLVYAVKKPENSRMESIDCEKIVRQAFEKI